MPIQVQSYSFEGFYKYNNLQGKLTGEIDIDENGFFENIIIDHMSRIPEQIFKGQLQNIEVISKLDFFKYPQHSKLANLMYQLEKPVSEDFSGKYVGQWGALPFKVEPKTESGLFLVQIDLSVCNIGDYAELNLYKK
ncbi:MAG: hypothetical protein ACP5N1_03580 [Candidatus Woesearchaeota archaeon]